MADPRRPLEGMRRLVVDGTNVLHALGRSPKPLPPAALVGRIRAAIPPEVSIVVVLDGGPDHGLATRRIASGVEVRYASREPADRLILRLVDDGAAETLVVTDDAELTYAVRRFGVRTVRDAWLLDQLARQRLVAPAPARPSAPPRAEPTPAELEAESAAPRWSPGRGATRKRGNARRSPKRGAGSG